MTNKKTTKRALVSSALTMLMCMTMLIGTTFAWFTDTASTSVNKIQAGTLDVTLEMKEDGKWVSAEGKTLDFVKAEGNESEEILWEPGCTYKLPELRIVNKGNLALQYTVKISGIQSNDRTGAFTELQDVIEWNATVASNPETTMNLVSGVTGHLSAKTETDAITVSGHMKKTAGNEYQGLSISGISVVVYATQYTEEYDSSNNTYDENAMLTSVSVTYDNKNNYKNGTFDSLVFSGATLDLHQNSNESATFSNCTFLCGFGSVDVEQHGTFIFENCTFYERVHLGNLTGATIEFKNCTFTSSSDLKIGENATSVTLTNCTFEPKDTIPGAKIDTCDYETGRILVCSNITFKNCELKREIFVYSSMKDNITITKENCTEYIPVSTAAELKTKLTAGKNIVLQNDVVLTEDWNSVKVVTGSIYVPIATAIIIDGGNHAISGLTAPLLAANSAANITITDLTIKNSTIASGEDNGLGRGAFVACKDNTGNGSLTLKNCHLINSTVTAQTGAGALIGYVGQNDVTIENCSAEGCTINGNDVGGLVGFCMTEANKTATIANCTVINCTLFGTYKGQIAGTVNNNGILTIDSCTFTGNAVATGRDYATVVIK